MRSSGELGGGHNLVGRTKILYIWLRIDNVNV
jgi:hypothetical protein